MLIRRGKAEGWLHLDPKALKTWAEASGITFANASPIAVPGRGTGLLADRDLKTEASLPTEILTIDEELVLSGEAVRRHAQFDKDFREVLESLGDFGRVGSSRFLRAFPVSMTWRRAISWVMRYVCGVSRSNISSRC